MTETPLHFKTITELAGLIHSRQLSPVEVTQAMLGRIDALDSRLKSFATVMAEHALSSAKAAEQAIGQGRYLGPLHGVPVAVKDLCFTKNVPTMAGARVLREHIPDFDATVIAKLLAAGAILLGKLNLTEGAMAGYHPEFQIPVNPWDPQRWSGASSSGSGVATAAGMCFGSLGSDTGGSIRFPAAACGIVGLKPTWGRVSRFGVMALAESMDHVGPMTRSVSDAGIVLQAIAGHDANDPTSLLAPVPNMLDGLERGVQGIRIGLDERYVTENIDAELSEAVLASVRIMGRLGAQIIPLTMPDTTEYVKAWNVLCAAEAVAAHRNTYPSQRDVYGLWFRAWLDKGAGVTGAEYAVANNVRAACNGLLAKVFEDIDILVSPSMNTAPGVVKAEDLYGPMGDGEDDGHWGRFTIPFDFNGAPTLSLPCGLNGEGLPLSIQFVGKRLAEPMLCQVGYAYEQATQWHNLRPPV
ncbi:MAG: amidase [SAR202 cluster bacterium Io17-Chloro-G7]|nr:MAG: amidase [SAR202 cluster bacterium Io17-Chloro-G7]